MEEERKNIGPRNREVLTNIDFKIQRLYPLPLKDHLEILAPLRPLSKEEIENLKLKFRELGFKVDNLTEKEKNSLKKSQFRGKPGDYHFLEKGRGPGMKAIMGEERVKGLIDFCYETAIDSRWEKHVIGGHNKTQGRGLQQIAADLFSLTILGEKEQTVFIHSINQRVLKGLRLRYKNNPEIFNAINEKFKDVPEPQDKSKIASVPPGTVWEIWRYLIGITP
jgi:hypothetical protein